MVPPCAASPSTDLLVLSCRVQVQLSIRANTLGHQSLCISQPLAEVIHVTVELPPLLYSAVETPAAEQETGRDLLLASMNRMCIGHLSLYLTKHQTHKCKFPHRR